MPHDTDRLLALAEPVIVALRIASSGASRPDAARSLLDEAIRALRAKAEKSRVPTRDVDDVVYALAAHVDEVMLARAATRQSWLPRLLQLALFRENNAGDGFFTRLEALRRDPSRGDVLLVYFVVLALGFRGRLAGHDVARLELIESVQLDLIRAGATPDAALAPDAIPLRRRVGVALDPRWALLVGALACLLAAGTWTLFALELWLHMATALGA